MVLRPVYQAELRQLQLWSITLRQGGRSATENTAILYFFFRCPSWILCHTQRVIRPATPSPIGCEAYVLRPMWAMHGAASSSPRQGAVKKREKQRVKFASGGCRQRAAPEKKAAGLFRRSGERSRSMPTGVLHPSWIILPSTRRASGTS